MASDDQDRQFTVFAIAGFAGAGKDTMADALSEALPEGTRYTRIKMADALKGALNIAFQSLGVNADCYTENRVEKEKLRPLMKEFGRYCRSRDRGVFASKVTETLVPLSLVADVVFVPDMRYLNEYQVLDKLCSDKGWNYCPIYIECEGVGPANDEEEQSLSDLLGGVEGQIHELVFNKGDMDAIEDTALDLVKNFYL